MIENEIPDFNIHDETDYSLFYVLFFLFLIASSGFLVGYFTGIQFG